MNEQERCPFCGSPVRSLPPYVSRAEKERREKQLDEITAGIRQRMEAGIRRAQVEARERHQALKDHLEIARTVKKGEKTG